MVDRNSVTTMLRKRGATRNATGSIAKALSASICSVTAIVPSSAVLFAPTLPLIMSAVSNGAILAQRAEARSPAQKPVGPVALHDGRRLNDHDAACEQRRDRHDGQ